MNKIEKIKVAAGIYWISVPEADVHILCGCPADSVKHLMKRGLINSREESGFVYETGPNAILLSDILIQNGDFSNLAEFPVLQMLYRQGMLLPDHPNNKGIMPLLIGSFEQVKSQMQYIYRGNYGLISEEELIESGIEPERVAELMRLKLKFAFGKIKKTEELLDLRILENDIVEIKNEVYISRHKINVFEIQYKNESITVDLNLVENEKYESAYPLSYYDIKREYFGVLHSGDGDGWDTSRPTMASIIMFQGKIYLIDAGPNISYSLNALGIGINEIEGIFHTHAHDDHFCGLTTLMNSDHKIKYFSTSAVRASVTKKLQALLGKTDEVFNEFFEVIDLAENVWNNVGSLQVKPIFSPHPLETSMFLFRAASVDGYKYYGHFADIIDLDILEKWVTDDNNKNGVTSELFEQVKKDYLQKIDLKKIDIGGGLIHGNAANFKNDKSKKIILSHTSLALTNEQKKIGSGASFGMMDTLIPTHRDYLLQKAYYYLKSYFPAAPLHQVEILLNNPVKLLNPEEIILKNSEISDKVYLILTGNIEALHNNKRTISAGGLIGISSSIFDEPEKMTYRASSYSKTLVIPSMLFKEFINSNDLFDEFNILNERRKFIDDTWLFGDSISHILQNKIAHSMEIFEFPKDTVIEKNNLGIYFIISGAVELSLDNEPLNILKSGDFFGESAALYNIKGIFKKKCIDDVQVYFIENKIIGGIPAIYWKLQETYDKRMRMIFSPEFINKFMFAWNEHYSLNIPEIDKQHKKMFALVHQINENIIAEEEKHTLLEKLTEFITFSKYHFTEEEKIMTDYNYPRFEIHRNKHKYLIQEIVDYKIKIEHGLYISEKVLISFLKFWVIEHILTEDKRYGIFINSQNSENAIDFKDDRRKKQG